MPVVIVYPNEIGNVHCLFNRKSKQINSVFMSLAFKIGGEVESHWFENETKGVVAGKEREIYVEDAAGRERYVAEEYLSSFIVFILGFATFLGILTSCDIKLNVVNSTQIHLLWF